MTLEYNNRITKKPIMLFYSLVLITPFSSLITLIFVIAITVTIAIIPIIFIIIITIIIIKSL